jgi:hypothetical protein
MALRSLAVVALFGAAQAATPALTSGGVSVPHFGNGKAKSCVPRARERTRAIMNDKSTARFEGQPRASNRPCT